MRHSIVSFGCKQSKLTARVFQKTMTRGASRHGVGLKFCGPDEAETNRDDARAQMQAEKSCGSRCVTDRCCSHIQHMLFARSVAFERYGTFPACFRDQSERVDRKWRNVLYQATLPQWTRFPRACPTENLGVTCGLGHSDVCVGCGGRLEQAPCGGANMFE